MNTKLRIAFLIEIVKEKVFYLGVVALFVCIGWWQMPSIDFSSSYPVFGQVVGLRGQEGDGVKLFLDVELDSGKRVLVHIPNRGAYYRKGERLRLLKKNTKLFGSSSYIFQQYVGKTKI